MTKFIITINTQVYCNYQWWLKVKRLVNIALLNKSSHSYKASLAIRDHTVLPATPHKWTHPALTPARGQYSIYLPQRDERLSWPRWLDWLHTEMVYPPTDGHLLSIFLVNHWSFTVSGFTDWLIDWPIQVLTRQHTAGSQTRNLLITSLTP